MARRVFFSFHYQKDIWRVSQVRNSWVAQKGSTNQFLDAASWEAVRRRGDAAVKAWIDRQLHGTGVTVVLIGEGTAQRRYVQYEVSESFERGNGLVGIYINRLRDRDGYISAKGPNPLDRVRVEWETKGFFFNHKSIKRLSDIFPTYDWVRDDGRRNIGRWIEEAAAIAGR